MSFLVAPLPFDEELRIKVVKSHVCSKNRNKYCRKVLKSKCSFTSKCYKCARTLNCKLRKYKLRKNGEEDPDIVDVSHVLLSSLKIRSPNKLLKKSDILEDDELLRPKNYLFKMPRHKLKARAESTEVCEKKASDTSLLVESQKKTQTNAFTLLMDSRNKSIGSNSPGKEKSEDLLDFKEVIEKKNAKVKRTLALQKLAEAKGAREKKELDNIQEMCIQKKMDERAERLKDMLVNAKPRVRKKAKESKKLPHKEVEKLDIKDDSSSSNDGDNKHGSGKEAKSLHLIDIFQDVIKSNNNINKEKKCTAKEDEEFLSKLSPSIKRKENMLSYFKKVEKKSPDASEVVEKSETVIKVKLPHKKDIKKKHLSLSKNIITTDVLRDHNENNSSTNETNLPNQGSDCTPEESTEHKERKKRKRKENSTKIDLIKLEMIEQTQQIELTEIEGRRPKRIVRRPVKYNDDLHISSSDEELHIFTPKKKRQGNENEINKNNKVHVEVDDIVILDDDTQNKVSKHKKTLREGKSKQKVKPSKLAPIFVPKLQLNPEQLEAKQKFLYSGVPEQIKKIISHQKCISTDVTNDFTTVVHVQQNIETVVENFVPTFSFVNECISDEEIVFDVENSDINLNEANETDMSACIPPLPSKATTILQTIKEQYPKFPVYRTYQLLKQKSQGEIKEINNSELENSVEVINDMSDLTNDNLHCLNWTNKYKATSTKNLLGNFESTRELKKWLQTWIEIESRSKNTPSYESDSSDFCYDSDSNSKECMKSVNNLLVLNGPVGCGKTSSVYAVASELAMKVIEVNASSKRTGKMMLQDLQEATQSHKVNRGCADNSQKSQESVPTFDINAKNKKKRGRPKKETKSNNKRDNVLSQQSTNLESGKTGISLILVDDADIVFDQDDGFSSAIAQLIQTSKRPVILVTSSLSCPHLQKFVNCGKVINLHPLPSRILGTWLDIMCLADSGACWPGTGARFLDYFKGDIRKAINSLQFYITSYAQNQEENTTSQNSDCKFLGHDEGSNISWADNECTEDKTIQPAIKVKDNAWKYFMNRESHLSHLNYPLDLISVWCSVPSLLKLNLENASLPATPVSLNTESKELRIEELDSIGDALDALSLADYYTCRNPDAGCNITSQPWYTSESVSVSETESYSTYSKMDETTNNIVHELITGSIINAQKSLQLEKNVNVTFPSMTAQREKDRMVSRHNNLTDILNPSGALDRKALALDYWSSLRTMCRIEKDKTDVVSKRKNRFCHYLKSLNSTGGSSMFDSLAKSLFEGKGE